MASEVGERTFVALDENVEDLVGSEVFEGESAAEVSACFVDVLVAA